MSRVANISFPHNDCQFLAIKFVYGIGERTDRIVSQAISPEAIADPVQLLRAARMTS